MTDHSKQMLTCGAIVAAAGILVGTICQASLTDPSQCRPASNAALSAASVSAAYGDAMRHSLAAGGACASSDNRSQSARVAEPEFVHVVQIASGARSVAN